LLDGGIGEGGAEGETHEMGGPSGVSQKWATTFVLACFLPFLPFDPLLTLNAMTGIDEPLQRVGNPTAACDEMKGAQRGLVELSSESNPTTAGRNQSQQVGYEDDGAHCPRFRCRDDI